MMLASLPIYGMFETCLKSMFSTGKIRWKRDERHISYGGRKCETGTVQRRDKNKYRACSGEEAVDSMIYTINSDTAIVDRMYVVRPEPGFPHDDIFPSLTNMVYCPRHRVFL